LRLSSIWDRKGVSKYPAEFLGFYGIQEIAHMIVCGQCIHTKQCMCVVGALVLIEQLLMSQKRRTLTEKHYEGGQSDLLHRILSIAIPSGVEKILDISAE
jgi:hypothetical protein